MRVVEIPLSIGEAAWVTPISEYARGKLLERAEQEFPYPDPKPFEVEIDPERSAIPGTKIPAKDNPEYQELCKAVMVKRISWHTDQCILVATHFDDEAGLVKRYADELAMLGKLLQLPEDPWEATLLYVLLQTPEDRRQVISAITGRMALTEEEKRDSLRIFRPQISGNGHPNGTRPEESPNLEEEESVQP